MEEEGIWESGEVALEEEIGVSLEIELIRKRIGSSSYLKQGICTVNI